MSLFDFLPFTLEQLYKFQQDLKIEINTRETQKKMLEYKNQLNQGYPVFTIDDITGLGPEYKSTGINIPIIAGSTTRSKCHDDIKDSVYFRYIDNDFELADTVDFVRNHMDRFEINDIDYEDYDSPIHVTGYIPITVTHLPMREVLNREPRIHECWDPEGGLALLVLDGNTYQLYVISKKKTDFKYKDRYYEKVDCDEEYIDELVPLKFK